MDLLAHAKQHLLGLLLVGLVFYVIERVMGARRRPGYFRPGMLTDTAYFFTVEFFKQASRVLLIVPFAVLIIAGVTTGEAAKAGLYHGFGPVAQQPVWLQAVEIYLLADFSATGSTGSSTPAPGGRSMRCIIAPRISTGSQCARASGQRSGR
jgi:hypothetical protein